MTSLSLEKLFALLLGCLLATLVGIHFFTPSSLDPRLLACVLCAFAVAFLARGGRGKGRPLLLILLFAAAAWGFAFNQSRFHRGFLHHHDLGHYYLGSRYFAELGYFDLYDGMTLALEELGDAAAIPEQVRDLRSKKLTPRDREKALAVKNQFSAERWRDFKADVATLRASLPEMRTFLQDHGYNATPLFTALFRPLAQAIPAGSRAGLEALAVVDVALLALAFVFVVKTFGLPPGLLALTYVLLVYGSLSGWIGGAFGRLLWWTLLVAGLCLLEKKRPMLAGAALGLAALLQIFPALFLLPAAARTLRREAGPAPWSLLKGAAFSGLAGITLATLATGFAAWAQMLQNLLAYLAVNASNAIGFRRVLFTAAQLLRPLVGDEVAAWLGPISSLLSLSLAAAVLTLSSRWRSQELQLAAGAALAFLVFNLAGYYYLLLVVPLLALRRSNKAWQAFFAVEGLCWLAQLLGAASDLLFLWRSLLLGWLLLAPFFSRLLALPPAAPAEKGTEDRDRRDLPAASLPAKQAP